MIANDTSKQNMLKRLARVEGQVRGVRKLVEESADCERVAQQMAAARAALDKAFHEMLGCMLDHVAEQQSPEGRAMLDQVRQLLARYG